MAFGRRIETGHRDGRAVVISEAVPAKTVDRDGLGVSELFSLDRPPRDAGEGGDAADPAFFLEPPAGGATLRVIRIPATGDWLHVDGEPADKPGWHRTDTLDVELIVEGEIVLGLDDGEHHLRAGDVVVQRGTAHRWKVVGDGPCTYVALMLRPEAATSKPDVLAARGGEDAPRRLVTGTVDGRAVAELDEPAPMVLRAGGTRITDFWQTGGPLLTVDQGGDPEGSWELEPAGGGIVVRLCELPAGQDPGEAGWHTTNTIDVDYVLSGAVALELRGEEPVIARPGDSVLQRGTEHRWVPVGDEPFRMLAVMFGLRD